MKVVTLADVKGTDREVHCPNGGFISYRYLLERDKMGFSVHKTVIPAGEPQTWHYKNHLEACYCISGHGLLKNLENGNIYDIKPDTCYVLDSHDKHMFMAYCETVLISIFNPPVKGTEVHDKNGSYKIGE